jgi:hypothetical protein
MAAEGGRLPASPTTVGHVARLLGNNAHVLGIGWRPNRSQNRPRRSQRSIDNLAGLVLCHTFQVRREALSRMILLDPLSDAVRYARGRLEYCDVA